MTTLVFVEHNGEEHAVEATPGDSIICLLYTSDAADD